MEPPDPCEPLEKLVDRLNEQLDVLCSQDQEHGVFQNLIRRSQLDRYDASDAEGHREEVGELPTASSTTTQSAIPGYVP